MKRTPLPFVLLLFVLAALMLGLNALQGAVDATPAPAPIQSSSEPWWQLLVTPGAYLVASLVRKLLPRIPGSALVWVAPVAGALLDVAATNLGLWGGGPGEGAILGAAATWAHQLGKQTGVIGPSASAEGKPPA